MDIKWSLCSELPPSARLDFWISAILFIVWGAGFYVFPDHQFYVLCAIVIPCFLIALLFLSAHWSISLAFVLRYKGESNVLNATHVKCIPAVHSGSAAICPLNHPSDSTDSSTNSSNKTETQHDLSATTWFMFQAKKYLHNLKMNDFTPLQFPMNLPIKEYYKSTGLSDENVKERKLLYGDNIFDIPIPTFNDLFKEHAVAPFFVFQMFCVLLWCLDEYWYYSILTLVMLILFETTVVKKRLDNLQNLLGMRSKPHDIHVFRNNNWLPIKSDQLYPGDIVSFGSHQGDFVTPCDLLLLSGGCVVDEALLTGESVPQLKDSFGSLGPTPDTNFDVDKHKVSLVSGGTKIILVNPPRPDERKRFPLKPSSKRQCIAYVLRTGFDTSQGQLVRTILFSSEHTSVNSAEPLIFIGCLLILAIVASGYVLYYGLLDETRSRYKLMLNCIMIVTSVVPPELPMELSLAVNNSLLALVRKNIFCTEPFRITKAGAVDICCFDKTGTLTSDDFKVLGVAGVDSPVKNEELVPPQSLPSDSLVVLGSCHSLSEVSKELIGDPQEKAVLQAIGWSFSSGNVASSRAHGMKVTILHRFPFSSALKRMSCIVGIDNSTGTSFWSVVKGAPETLRSRYAQLPENYDQLHRSFSRQGSRVLALGYRVIADQPTIQERREITNMEISRETAETELKFAGFLILDCPMKKDSFQGVQDLLNSTHEVVMITGDHILTACSVARKLNIIAKPELILQIHRPSNDHIDVKSDSKTGKKKHSFSDLKWMDVDDKTSAFDISLAQELAAKNALCITGRALQCLMDNLPDQQVAKFVRLCKVFARTTPDQKQFILTWLKSLGLTTLMCGDGTNDVGALKQAHVGVALLNQEPPETAAWLGADAARARVAQKMSKDGSSSSSPISSKDTSSQQHTPITGIKKRRGGLRKKERYQTKAKSQLDEKVGFGDELPSIKLGDASIASPFTSKFSSIISTCHIIRQGRCTLVTTLQMFRILALNCLISAYSMSVLYLEGVKYGDTQMTISGLAVAMFFLFLSRSLPLRTLSAERPPSKLFSFHMLCSILGQFIIHFAVLIMAVQLAKPFVADDKEAKDPDGDFSPNVLNSVVFLISTCMTVSTFLCNYKGHPFMQSISENRPFYWALIVSTGLLWICALELVAPVNEMFELSPMPSPEFSTQLWGLMILDMGGAYIYSRIISRIFR